MKLKKVDLRNVASPFDPVDAGVYPCIIKEIEEKVGKESGDPYLNVTLEICEGPYEGKKIWGVLTMPADQSKWWGLKQFAEALGYDLDNEELSVDTDEWLGQKINVDVKKVYDKERDETKNNIRKYLPY